MAEITRVRSKVKTDQYRRCDMMIQRANSFIKGHPFTGIPNALSVSFFVHRFSDQGRSEDKSPILIPLGFKDISSPSRVDESGAIGRPDVSPPRPEKKSHEKKGRVLRNATFFSDGCDVITALCEPSRITNSEGHDDDRDKKTPPPR